MANRRDADERMWSQACELLAEAERLHRRFFRIAPGAHVPAAWEPPIDVFEDERELVVVVAMPGVSADRVEVRHDGEALVVRGMRGLPIESTARRWRQLEIPYGLFERRIELPPGRFEIGRPEVAHGCLTLRLRKLGPVR